MSDTHDGNKWSFRAQIGFYLVSTALTVLGLVSLMEYRNEVRALKEDRDHDYRERVAYTNLGWKMRSEKQDSNIQARSEFIDAILAHCKRERNGCNLPDNLTIPPPMHAVESTESFIIASQLQAMKNTPYGTKEQD